MEQLKKTLEMDPNYAQAVSQLSREYFDMGKYDLWLETWKKSMVLFQRPDELAIAEDVSRVYSKSGFKPALLRGIEMRKQLANHRYVDPADIAYDYAALGDKEQTFAWLDKAAAEKSGGLEVIKVVPAMDPWRSDPRPFRSPRRYGQLANLNDPMCELQSNVPFTFWYWFVYQNVQSLLGSTCSAV